MTSILDEIKTLSAEFSRVNSGTPPPEAPGVASGPGQVPKGME